MCAVCVSLAAVCTHWNLITERSVTIHGPRKQFFQKYVALTAAGRCLYFPDLKVAEVQTAAVLSWA